MQSLSRFALATLAAAALAIPLKAEEPRFGVQGLVNAPLGDLKDFVDSKPGVDVGIHGTFDLGAGNMIRPRLDYNYFPDATLSGIKNTAYNVGLGADYLYFIAGKPEGFYLTGGLSLVRWSFETKDPVLGNATTDTTKLGVAVGAGYQWNRTLGTEARYTTSKVSDGFTADALQAGVTIRF
jgi:hypothetical protein